MIAHPTYAANPGMVRVARRWNKEDGRCTQENLNKVRPGAILIEARPERVIDENFMTKTVVLCIYEIPEDEEL